MFYKVAQAGNHIAIRMNNDGISGAKEGATTAAIRWWKGMELS